MEEKTNITVILPIIELNEGLENYFKNAILSISEQLVKPDKVLIISKNDKELLDKLKAYDYGTISSIVEVIVNDGKTDYCSQINYGVSKCNTEWVSILEIDDEYSKIWFKNVVNYIKHENKDVYLPIIVDTDAEGRFIGFMNEAVWANEFSQVIGVVDNDALMTYQNFNLCGSVFRKSLFTEFGGLKSNIKLTFIYEYLLRLTYNSAGVMVIPKIGYKHTNFRKDGLFDVYKNTISNDESAFWLETAKKEYFFDYDRDVLYEVK